MSINIILSRSGNFVKKSYAHVKKWCSPLTDISPIQTNITIYRKFQIAYNGSFISSCDNENFILIVFFYLTVSWVRLQTVALEHEQKVSFKIRPYYFHAQYTTRMLKNVKVMQQTAIGAPLSVNF